jgi:Cu(I)/Ag(I) efflux system membrane fusion protein
MAGTIDVLSDVLPQRSGIVDTVFPTLKEDTRTIELRLVVDNPDGALYPNALTRVVLEGDPIENVLTVPASAVIQLGESARVVRILDEGRFKPVPVTIGPRVGERIIVENGVEEGDRIVAAAHFLIDSESSLQAGVDRLAASHGAHQGMDHAAPAQRGPERGSSGETAPEENAPGESAMEGGLVWGEGKIAAIEGDRRIVTLDHAPVPGLGWPAMVMDFRVSADVAIDDLKVGDEIMFGFAQTPEGRYEIREVRPAGHHR